VESQANEEDKKISVIMGIYNCADTLPQAIDSILAQTYDNWELIMCDDCSTDNTYEVAEEYRRRYPEKIILLKNEVNSKLSYTLNHCLRYATGEYVARMDGDDISLPQRFERQAAFLAEHPQFQLVGTGMIPFDEHGERSPPFQKETPDKYDLAKGPCFAHATIMTYKRVYDETGGYRVSPMTVRTQDYDLWFRFFYFGFKGYNLQEALYKAREDETAFKRRKWWVYWNAAKIEWHGFRLLKFPFWYYIYSFRKVLRIFVPQKLVYLMRKRRGN